MTIANSQAQADQKPSRKRRAVPLVAAGLVLGLGALTPAVGALWTKDVTAIASVSSAGTPRLSVNGSGDAQVNLDNIRLVAGETGSTTVEVVNTGTAALSLAGGLAKVGDPDAAFASEVTVSASTEAAWVEPNITGRTTIAGLDTTAALTQLHNGVALQPGETETVTVAFTASEAMPDFGSAAVAFQIKAELD